MPPVFGGKTPRPLTRPLTIWHPAASASAAVDAVCGSAYRERQFLALMAEAGGTRRSPPHLLLAPKTVRIPKPGTCEMGSPRCCDIVIHL
jgi:hypothetical protein